MKTYLGALLLTASVLVAACGGGSSSGGAGSSPPPPPPTPVAQKTGGLWFGTLTSDMNMVTEDYIALTSDDGRFRLLSVDSDVQFVGFAMATGNALSGTARAFADSGVNWLDGNHVADATITGVITERGTMSGSWVLASGESGTFDLAYDALFEKGSSTAMLQDIWTGYDDFGNPDVTFTIDANGAFNGQNARGCVSVGQFTEIDPATNLYQVQSDISNCAIAGSYSGLAFLADLFAVNDALVISIDNDQQPILLGLER